MIYLFMSLLVNLLPCTGSGAVNNVALPIIEEILLYEYYEIKGYSLAAAHRQFEILEKDGIPKLKLAQSDVDTFNDILSMARKRKQFTGKLETRIAFTLMKSDEKMRQVAILKYMIIDFTNNQYYLINNQKHRKWISDFTERTKPK